MTNDNNLILIEMKHYILICLLMFIAYACKEEPIGQTPVDSVPPGEVSNVEVTNIPGGAYFTYTLPDDEDLLYVKAVYRLKENGESLNTRSSLYTDTLRIEGFGDTKERNVDLIAVDRSNNESKPVTVSIKPDTPPVFTIFESMELAEEFGGIKFKWNNETATNICLHILKKNKSGDFEMLDELYTKRKLGESTVLGLSAKEGDFGIYVTDRWGNNSDTLKKTLTPIFEMQIPYSDIKPYNMLGDTPSEHGWLVDYLWNDIIHDGAGAGYHTEVFSGPWPHRVTFKVMTGKIKCSRIKIYHRDNGYLYKHGNVKKFELWASNNPNPDGSDDGWVKIGDYESYKPSGLPGTTTTNEDLEYAALGESFPVPAEFESYQYFRTKFTDSWSGSKFVHILEIQLFGRPDGYVPEDDDED